MNQYDFNILSPVEFEEFSKDLLSKEYQLDLESFADGRDKGIDLRYATDKYTHTIVVQCKRYKQASSLLDALKKERKKLDKLTPRPNRYILVTSVALSETRVNEIFKLFSPYILRTTDIIQPKKLNSLLHKHADVEKRHYKLWIASSNVLQHILSCRITKYTRLIEEEILDTLRLYSPTPSYGEAMQTLRENGFLIIAGQAGVGKTTLADVISYNLLGEKDFDELIALPQDINDAVAMMSENPEKKQLFIFDDFLGSNFLEQKLARHEDSVFKTLINHIGRLKKTKALIMTTREYILHQAQQSAEIFKDDGFLSGRYIVDLDKYDNMTKARILYNHIAASDIPETHLKYFLDKKVYARIIKHRNYSPRLIASLTSQKIWENRSPEEFCDKAIDLFDHPWSLYEDIYENKIDELERSVLLVLMSIGRKIGLQDLHRAVVSFDPVCNDIRLKKALDVIDGTFIRTTRNNEDKVVVDFLNPTVSDFLTHYYQDKMYTLERLVDNAVYLNQLTYVFDLSGEWVSPFKLFGINAMGILPSEKIRTDTELMSHIEAKILNDRHALPWVNSSASTESYDEDIFARASTLLEGQLRTPHIKKAVMNDLLQALRLNPQPTKHLTDALSVYEWEFSGKDLPSDIQGNYVASVADSVSTYNDLEEFFNFRTYADNEAFAQEVASVLSTDSEIESILADEAIDRINDGESGESVIDTLTEMADALEVDTSFIRETVYSQLRPTEDETSNFYSRSGDFEHESRKEIEHNEDDAIDEVFSSLK
jgi:hypothetical protein